MAASLQDGYESRGAKSSLSFLPHSLWGHGSRNIWVHQILSGGRNVSADSKAGNYWNNCQLGHSYGCLLSLWELISNNPVPSTNRWKQRTPPGIMQLDALEMRYLIAIKLTGSATGTFQERKWPYWRRMSGKVEIVWLLENTTRGRLEMLLVLLQLVGGWIWVCE